ncbi:SMI1/KNR4 family protein [Schaedlerella arabinosiphila]|uniref:SMI1/KNR4 family protein n=1 Tax=Schaedlerella arabinosiphila TaxID=2044587 RepID=UPI002557F842|nr:SMI1/KNR4 family protein [Schaedlerella arabinosiphila]
MSQIAEIVDNLQDLLFLEPAKQEDIRNIENELKLTLAEEYKEYLLKYGAVIAENVELTGIAKSKDRNVISVTKREWEVNDKIKHDMYVVENLGIDGIMIWQESSGKIYESMPNCDAKLIAGSLAEYLKEK